MITYFRPAVRTVKDLSSIMIAVSQSNGVVGQCNALVQAGGDTPETHIIDMGTNSGSFAFEWNTFTQQDQIIVTYEGNTLFDSGCIGSSSCEDLTFSGSSTQVTVAVTPNCAGGEGTIWEFTVNCPPSSCPPPA